MIASQKIGKSFAGALNYNIKKLYHPDESKRAELLDSNFAALDTRLIQQELKLVRNLKPNLSRYVYHTSLNFSEEDVLDNDKLLDIAHDYLRESGYTNNHYMIFRHHDAPHPHIHLLVNRITFEGEVVSDSNNYQRSEEIIRRLEQRYGLKKVQSSKEATLKAARIGEIEMSVRTGRPSDKLVLQHKLSNIIGGNNNGSSNNNSNNTKQSRLNIQDFINQGEQQGIHFLFNQAANGKVSGITYFHNGFKVKGQVLGNKFKWAELTKQINYGQIRDSTAIGEANSRTRAIYGELTTAGNGLQPAEQQRSNGNGDNELYTGRAGSPQQHNGHPATAGQTGTADSRAEERALKTNTDVYTADDGTVNPGHDSLDHSYGHEISDDVDDEAVYGRSRRKDRQSGGYER